MNATAPFDSKFLEACVDAELDYIRGAGATEGLAFAFRNPSTFEAVLTVLRAGEEGVPVFEAITSVRSRFSAQVGVIQRIRKLREAGVLEDRPGLKGNQVRLVASEHLFSFIYPLFLEKAKKYSAADLLLASIGSEGRD